MRIAIVAAGAVGGYYGGLLARSGENVVALARSAHLAAIQANGLRVEGAGGDFTVRLAASDDAAALGVAEIVLFAVKLYQAAEAARAAAPLFGPGTLGISLMNGMGGPELIADALPGATILGGCTYVGTVIAAPGLIRCLFTSPITFGAPRDAAACARAADFAARCARAGFEARMSDDIRAALWGKLIGLSTHAALTAASRLPAGPLYRDPDVMAVVAALIEEGIAVAAANGVSLPADIEETWLARFRGFPAGAYASMYQDIAKGGPMEVDGFSGHIVREGRRLGIPTPHHAALYAVLKPHRAGAPTLA
jgi:2-dehydropantoate 2-reductase